MPVADASNASLPPWSTSFVLLFVVAKLTIHLVAQAGDGYFRDELYYLACADHLDFGYVDHPPFSIAILWLVRGLFGDSVPVLRFVAAACGAGTIVLTSLIARRLGGAAFAQALAMMCVLVAPVMLGVNSFYSMNSFDILLWTWAALLILRVLQEGSFGAWLVLGVLLGLGLENKISVSWLGAGLFVGLLLSPHRRVLRTAAPWWAAAVALVLLLPHVVWQVAHGWPTAEFLANARAAKMQPVSALQFVGNQVLVMHPLTVPIWLAGLVYLLFGRAGSLAPLGSIYVTTALLLVWSGTSRASYLAPAYPMLLAGGSVLFEAGVRRTGWRWLASASLATLAVGGVVTLPLSLPVLSPEAYVRYASMVGMQAPAEERGERSLLPQHLADRYGWEEMVATVADVYENLSPEDRAVAGIWASNYGEAGAIDRFGERHGLPRAISGHNSYWLWGPGQISGEVLIVVGVPGERLERLFGDVREAVRIRCRYCMPRENENPVFICRNPKRPLQELWGQSKRFI